MAVYKVPQDVEADDKLIGPFSFRQFIYLIVVAIAGAGAWGLSQLFIPLAIIPLPIIVFFAALALPLRKDQPMEAYLSAVVSFYFLKSRKRFWQPDGIDSFVTIIPPKNSDRILTKNLDEDEATKRLSYLSELVDSHGWAIRGAGGTPDTSIKTDLYYESQQATDVMDEGSDNAKALTKQLQDAAASQKEKAASSMKTVAKSSVSQAPVATKVEPRAQVATSTPQSSQATTNSSQTAATVDQTANEPVSTLPSLDEIRAKEKQNASKQAEKAGRDALAYANALAEEASEAASKTAAKPTATTSVSPPTTDTIELTKQQAEALSKQEGVTVQTIANQANRVANKNRTLRSGDEVVISLH